MVLAGGKNFMKSCVALLVMFLFLGSWNISFAETSDIDKIYKDEWTHIKLRSESQVNISIDFKVEKKDVVYGPLWTARPVWINISNESLGERGKVRIVFKNLFLKEYEHLTSYNQNPEIRDIEMNFAEEGRFTAEIPYGLSADILYRAQEISIAINDEWLTDPVNHTTTFKMNMAEAEKQRL